MTGFPMPQSMHVVAFHIAESIDIASFRTDYSGVLLAASGSELVYGVGEHQYLGVFGFGGVVFAGFNDAEATQTLNLLAAYCEHLLEDRVRDDLAIVQSDAMRFDFTKLCVPKLTTEVIRIAMEAAARSAAVAYYVHVCESLLAEVREITHTLEHKGRIGISKREMLKFIGKTLNTKNRIDEAIYIFDVPLFVWNNEYLDRINTGLIDHFELNTRLKGIHSRLETVEDNLSVFSDLFHHRESAFLEWIIIVLISIEVLDMFLSKFM